MLMVVDGGREVDVRFYFVGLDLHGVAHDYGPLSQAIEAAHGRKVSQRIWLCVVNRTRADALTRIYAALASGDQMMVVPVPSSMRLPDLMRQAA